MQDRRREKGSGIGKSHEEGGTNEESPIRERDAERGGKSGREKQTEGVKQRGKYTGSFLSRILSLRLSGAFPSLEKLFLFLCLDFFLSLISAPSTSLVSALSPPVSLLSPSFPLSVILFVHLSTPRTFCPYLRPSFDGLHSLLSSSRLIQPLFSQDASLQGVLHQNGTETERERELGIMLGYSGYRLCCRYVTVFTF